MYLSQAHQRCHPGIGIFPIRRIHTGASYLVLPSVKLYGAFDWRTERTSGRTGEHLTLDLSRGYAFDRMFFEGEDYREKDFNRIDVASGPLSSVQAAFRF